MTLRTILIDCDLCGSRIIKSGVAEQENHQDNVHFQVVITDIDNTIEHMYDVCGSCIEKVSNIFSRED